MICPNCGQTLPDDKPLKFCIFCGSPISAPPVPPEPVPVTFEAPAPAEPETPPAPPEPAPVTFEAPAPAEPETPPAPQKPPKAPKPPKPKKEKKPRSSGGSKAAIAVLAVFLVLALGAAGYLAYSGYVQSDRLASVQAQNADLEEQLTAQKALVTDAQEEAQSLTDEIARLEGEVDELTEQQADAEASGEELEANLQAVQEKANLYEALATSYRDHYFGLGSANFFVNRSILVASLSKGEEPMLTLNTTWDNGATVSVEYSSDCAMLDFLSDSWDVAVDMKMTPQREGFTVATFSNDQNHETFDVLLVVTK